MLMQLAVGLVTGAFAVGLVYGMKKMADFVHYKRDNKVSWKESAKVNIAKWYEWLSLLFFVLFVLMVVVGITLG